MSIREKRWRRWFVGSARGSRRARGRTSGDRHVGKLCKSAFGKGEFVSPPFTCDDCEKIGVEVWEVICQNVVGDSVLGSLDDLPNISSDKSLTAAKGLENVMDIF